MTTRIAPRLEAPAGCTPSCERYFAEHARILGFLGFVGDLAARQDRVVEIARRSVHPGAAPAPGDLGAAVAELRGYRRLILQMVLAREVDNYLIYLAEVLGEVFRSRPDMLRPLEQVPIDVVLAYERMEDLIEALVERRAEHLTRRGIPRLYRHLEDLGLRRVATAAEVERIDRIVQNRHLVVHARGRVSRHDELRLLDAGLRAGDVLELSFDTIMADVGTLADAVVALDARAVEKWRLAPAG